MLPTFAFCPSLQAVTGLEIGKLESRSLLLRTMWLKSRQYQELRRSGEDGARSSSEDREGTDVQDQVPKIGIEHARCRRWLVCLMWLNLALFSMSSTLFVLSLASARPLYVDRVPERQRNHVQEERVTSV